MIIATLKKWLSFRVRRKPITTIVLHATAGSTAAGAISTLMKKGFSYHYLIEDQRETDGKIIKCVPTSKVAFHAGVSSGPMGKSVNNYSIGVSFINLNNGRDPYSAAQYQSCLELCIELIKAIPTIQYITTHYYVSPGRKTDPKGFPVQELINDLNLVLPKPVKLWKPS